MAARNDFRNKVTALSFVRLGPETIAHSNNQFAVHSIVFILG